ncbi:MAG: HEPN domain-containing protein [Candidatus Methanomethyliaceae archaeon]|nr:HEPN domain-containing protein [Candidatus Methanomethyliaceae archaeon]MDW7970984.1 HEPN domain-containing protein [Nitrososphaerota archaeon]
MDESEYLRWMLFSRRTLDSAKGDLERGDYNWACFKSHQAAEFAVKALLRGLGMPSYGHSLSKLLKGMEDILKDGIIQTVKTLDKYYVPTRYPNAWVEGSPDEYYTKEDAEDAIRLAEDIIGWVEEKWRSLKKGES